MKIAILGTRTFNDVSYFESVIGSIISEDDTIISGGARGTDSLAEKYAYDHNIPIQIFKADWNKYGKAAGFIRNDEIWRETDIGVIFWDGESKGTAHSIQLAEKYQKNLLIVYYKEHILRLVEGGKDGSRSCK